MLEEDCDHSEIVPVDDDWAKCAKCGDNTFPISENSAYGADEPVELSGTINGSQMTGMAFGETGVLFRAQAAEAERDQLRTEVERLTKRIHDFENPSGGEGYMNEVERLNAELSAAVGENAKLTKQSDAWFRVHELEAEYGNSFSDPDEDFDPAEADALATKIEEAVENAHTIDNRRCPECKGALGFVSGRELGFVPCPNCDGNPWEEVLAEMADELDQEGVEPC